MKSNKRNKIGKTTGMKPNVDGIAEIKKEKNSSRVKNYEEFHH